MRRVECKCASGYILSSVTAVDRKSCPLLDDCVTHRGHYAETRHSAASSEENLSAYICKQYAKAASRRMLLCSAIMRVTAFPFRYESTRIMQRQNLMLFENGFRRSGTFQLGREMELTFSRMSEELPVDGAR